MTDTFEDGNQYGEPVDNVGVDEGTNTEESSTTWEEQAKYFQSEKDKLYQENQKLKQYEQVGQFLESRPDIVQEIDNMVKGGGQPKTNQPERVELSSDEFDPWEAYNDPSSKSYKFRMQEMQDTVNNAVGQQMQGIQQQQGMSQLQVELKSRGLNDEQVKSFMQFASVNPANYGVDGAIKMWQAVAGSGDSTQKPLDNVRQTQSMPTPGGVLDGQKPQAPKSDEDTMWDGVLNASRTGNKIP